ncbi:MAG TPA: hypothetical protein VFU21_25640 [Kofleriaceae bacterium]|nr:hypothetical protein [Kofleriaceae bacterium]
MERKDSVRVWSILPKLGLVALLGAAAVDGTGRAIADAPEPPTPPEEQPGEPAPEPFHPPNTLYTDGLEYEVPFEFMPPAEQAGVRLAGERTRYGAAVHGAWSTSVTRPRAAEAKLKKSAAQSGMTGLDTVGIEP